MTRPSASSGFTLIELLVVISIIGLLSSIVVASLNASREKGRIAAARQFSANAYHSLGDKLVGSWNFDELSGNAIDVSGNGKTGSVYNATRSSDTYSGFGSSMQFNGTTAYVEIPVIYDLDGSEETVSLWVKYDSPTSDFALFNQWNWRRRLFSTQWNLIDSNSTYHYLSVPGINDGKWHHVAYTVKGTSAKAFVDGRQTAAATMTAPMNAPLDIWRVGRVCAGSSCDLYYAGRVDDLSIYGSALSVAEIQRIYAQTAPKRLVTDK